MVYQIDTPGLEDLSVTTEKIDTAAVSTAQVDTTINNALVPIKGIIMFSGTESEIPANWSLCDGNNGTPNLTNQFVIAANSFSTNDNEWQSSVTGSNLPSGGSKDAIVVIHNHDISNDSHNHGVSNDSHNHGDSFIVGRGTLSATTTGNASHTHSVTVPAGAAMGGGDSPNYWQGSQTISTQSNTGDHDHGISFSGNPSLGGSVSANSTGIDIDNNSTGIDIDNEGSSGTNANLPPYFAIAYIMRVT
jgi:hypothetical protein